MVRAEPSWLRTLEEKSTCEHSEHKEIICNFDQVSVSKLAEQMGYSILCQTIVVCKENLQ